MGKQTLARLQVLAAAALFSTGAAAVKATTLSAWQVAGFRSGLAALVLVAVLRRQGRGIQLSAGSTKGLGAGLWVGLGVGTAYALALTGYVVANKLTGAASAIFLYSTSPFWVILLSPWLLRERSRARDVGLLALIAAGMVLVFRSAVPEAASAPEPLLGNWVAAGCGLVWALTVLGLRGLSRPVAGTPGDGADAGDVAEAAEAAGAGASKGGEVAVSAVVWGNALAFLLCLPLAFPVTSVSLADVASVGYLGIVQIAVAYLLLLGGLKRIRAVEASLLLLLEPVLNPFWAWLLHGERPGIGALTGGAIILAALALHAVWGARAGER